MNIARITSSFLILYSLFLILVSSCSVQQKIARSANEDVLSNKALQAAHVGISIFDPAANKYLYNYQGDKYFVPASNTKIPTCYAAMKYLGDSLVGLRYGIPEERGSSSITVIHPSGDPTFLHSYFTKQPVFDFLRRVSTRAEKIGFFIDTSKVERWGSGWSWNDYQEYYMAERNTFPIFGNVVNIQLNDIPNRNATKEDLIMGRKLRLFKTSSSYFDSVVNDISILQTISRKQFNEQQQFWKLTRSIQSNRFWAERVARHFSTVSIPFVTNGSFTAISILKDTLHAKFTWVTDKIGEKYMLDDENADINIITIKSWNKIHSQPTDSLLKLMMHRSDNFFAEQSLLMVSNEMLGLMNDEKIIDSLLKTDFKDLPQKPRWADGSGLSRYNLFTPQDLVAILNKMKNEFGMERIKVIFPTGGEGTISNYYKADSGYIYGKTGTLSGVVAFSGYLYTKTGKLLIFSTLVNNHQANAMDVRRAVEKFLTGVRSKF